MSRRLVITQNITADGVVEATGDWFAPHSGEDTADLLEVVTGHMIRDVGFLLGRRLRSGRAS